MKRLLLALVLAGCQQDALYVSTTDNQNFHVSLLFNHDGCKIYRFVDFGNHYFAKCENGTVATTSEIRSGKTSRPEEIQTVTK